MDYPNKPSITQIVLSLLVGWPFALFIAWNMAEAGFVSEQWLIVNLAVISLEARRPVKWSYRYEPTTPDCVAGDARRIDQIVANLLHNAIQWTERGFIEVSVEGARWRGVPS